MIQPLRHLSAFDRTLTQVDRVVRTLAPGGKPRVAGRPRPQPESGIAEHPLSEADSRTSAALMRVNHSGEVCAQALYQGQALGARSARVREGLEEAAGEEVDHLAWCEARLNELDGRTSVLNSLWNGLSFGLGAGAGLISDKVSLGFVAATEELVAAHLESHLQRLPAGDSRSRAIVHAMLDDERRHGETALAAGGESLPRPVKRLMKTVANGMTKSSYYL